MTTMTRLTILSSLSVTKSGIELLSFLLISTVCESCAARAIGIPMDTRTRFEIEWRDYQKYLPEKAFAVAGDHSSGLYVSGVAFGQLSEDSAKEEALRRCELRRADRRLASECRLYAIGDEIIAGAANAQNAR